MTRAEALNSAKPILFNTRMVQAILNGQKSCTRRVIKAKAVADALNSPARKENPDIPDKQFIECLCNAPYAAGNILYVRETWSDPSGEGWPYTYKTDFPMHWDADEVEIGIPIDLTASEYIWRPSIHMPKEAARIFLRATDVAVERLQDITTVGIRAEGINECFMCRNERRETKPLNKVLCSSTFIDLWNSTIKEKDFHQYGWDVNPWVWVIKFERLETHDTV